MAAEAWDSSDDLLSVECYLEVMLDELAPKGVRPSIYVLERRHELDVAAPAGDVQPADEGWTDFPLSRNL